MSAKRLTTLQNANVAEKVKINSGINKLVALDALPCDILECIAEQFIRNASPSEIDSMTGTLGILYKRMESARAKNA